MDGFDNNIYDRKAFWWTLVGILFAVAVQKVSEGAGFAALAPFALFALMRRSAEKMFFWILLIATLVVGNAFFMPKGAVFVMANRFVLGCFGLLGVVRLLKRRKAKMVTPFLWFLAYVAYMAIPSYGGWQPVVSYLKMFLFVVVFLAYFGVADKAISDGKVDVARLRAMMLAFASFFIVGSVCVMPFPEIGQLSGEEYQRAVLAGQEVTSLFKGLSSHSQAFGPMVAFFFVFLFADWAFGVRRFSKLYAFLLALCPFLIYQTSSRTAMASFVAGVLVVGFCLLQMRGLGGKWRSKVLVGMTLALCACCVAVVAVPAARDSVARLAMKYDRGATVGSLNAEGLLATRQFLIDAQLANLRRSPYVGNGFQVSEQMAGARVMSWKQLLTAPVEKGVWVTAILEEGGWFGLAVFVAVALTMLTLLIKRRAYMAFCLFSTLLVVNMAEFTMFAMSGLGGFTWALIFVGVVLDALRIRDDARSDWDVDWRSCR